MLEYVTVGGHGRPRGVVVCRHLSKYAPIFLLLALFGLIFLLRNIHTLEVSITLRRTARTHVCVCVCVYICFSKVWLYTTFTFTFRAFDMNKITITSKVK